MIDIHCHILPGLDDGAKTLEMAAAMAEMAIEDGITHVIGTPHAHPEFTFDSAGIDERCAELRKMFEGRLILATGRDFHLFQRHHGHGLLPLLALLPLLLASGPPGC